MTWQSLLVRSPEPAVPTPPATVACDGHVDVVPGECVGKGLADLSESYDCVAHPVSPISVDMISSLRGCYIKLRAVTTSRVSHGQG